MDTKNKKWVLISGAAGGIGSATVAVFADHGWQVVAVDRKTFEGVKIDGVNYIQADISNPDDVALIYKRTSEFTSTLGCRCE